MLTLLWRIEIFPQSREEHKEKILWSQNLCRLCSQNTLKLTLDKSVSITAMNISTKIFQSSLQKHPAL